MKLDLWDSFNFIFIQGVEDSLPDMCLLYEFIMMSATLWVLQHPNQVPFMMNSILSDLLVGSTHKTS